MANYHFTSGALAQMSCNLPIMSFHITVFRYKAKPRLEFHMRENLTIVFQFMLKVEKIPLVNIGEPVLCGTLNIVWAKFF